MNKADWKYLAALALAALFAVGAPLLLHWGGILSLDRPRTVAVAFALFYTLLAIRILFRGSAGQELVFLDHGFELALLSFGGFMTAHIMATIHPGPLVSVAADIAVGLAMSLFLTMLTAFIASRIRDRFTRQAAMFRGLNYILGAFAFLAYEIVMVGKGVQS